jgi:minor capsid protein
MILDELATYIDTNTALTLGTNLFESRLPESPATAVALAEYGGIAPLQTLGPTFVEENPRVQVVSRAADYATARTNAKTIWNLFKAFPSGTSLSGVVYKDIIPLQSPFLMMRDALDRPIVAFNLEVAKDFS